LPLELRKGDLFADESLSALAHGCNCSGSMGRGIAVEFRKRWPAMYEAYRAECKAGRFRPGNVFVWDAPARTIFNLATQPSPGPSARLEFIDSSLNEAIRIAESRSISLIGMPRIGAGYGGLDWTAVKRILEAVGAKTEVVLAVYEGMLSTQLL
jgi:O-acetyl-ADP-ribose deacetylase (regulator of RNase III)